MQPPHMGRVLFLVSEVVLQGSSLGFAAGLALEVPENLSRVLRTARARSNFGSLILQRDRLIDFSIRLNYLFDDGCSRFSHYLLR